MRRVCWLFSILLYGFLISGCISDELTSKDTLFHLLSSEETNITFQNEILENDSINLLTYEYIYNGGGVGILDVNNDSLPDIFFTASNSPSQLYLNQGDMKFKDITKLSGIDTKGNWCTGVSIVDINNDGYDDIYVCVGGPGNKSIYPNKLYINQGDLTFKESAKDYGLDDSGESIQAAFFDYDLDGDLDMYLLTGGGFELSPVTRRPILKRGESRNTDRLYQNVYDSISDQPVFRNVSDSAGILVEGFGLGVSIIDANQDGWPDVYVANDYLSTDLLYINNQDGSFNESSQQYFNHTSYFSMGCDAGDINNDGLIDLVTMDMLPNERKRRKLMFEPNQYERFHMSSNRNYGYQYMRNTLQLNQGDGNFSEIGQLAGIESTDWSWAPLLADLDNDGFLDLYVTNGFGKDVTDLDFVKFRQDAVSKFSNREDVEKAVYEEFKKQPSISPPNYSFKNNGNLTFSDESKKWGIIHSSISNGAAYADLDMDGDLDIIVNNIDREAFIYENKAVQRHLGRANFLKVFFAGPKHNPSGIGSTIYVYKDGDLMVRYHQVIRGFQSSIENNVHFGLGSKKQLDSVLVKWPDGKINRIYSVNANTNLLVNYQQARIENIKPSHHKDVSVESFFTNVDILQNDHKESMFNDFKNQSLLLHGFSNQGPGIAVGDVNNDQLEDVFIGGGYGSMGELFVQLPNGNFGKQSLTEENYEDLGAIFFDVDLDGDLDLYVTSGGSERYDGHEFYQDRLYLNDGSGNFQLDPEALPQFNTSTSIVTAGDYDRDGDLDLFVGGRVSPGRFPEAPESYLLRNDQGRFTNVTKMVCPELQYVGMVTAAVWTDFNNDFQPDLILAGEFMPITLFKNVDGKLINITESASLQLSSGMWNSLTHADFDNDGDMDYVAGNLGMNHSYDDVESHPLKIHFADFDNNGSVDPIYSIFEEGDYYPLASLDQLSGQLPVLKKQMLHYEVFAQTTTEKLLNALGKKDFKTLECQYLKSAFIENLGNDRFELKPLPVEAQFAPLNGVLSEDVDLDGYLDIISVGNMYNTEVVNGRYDASLGNVFLNRGDNSFETIPSRQSDFIVSGDAKAIARVELAGGKSLVLVTQNNDESKSYIIDQYNGLERLQLSSAESSALITFTNGLLRKVEFPIGASYLTQSSGQIVITPMMKEVELFDVQGKTTRKVSFDKARAD